MDYKEMYTKLCIKTILNRKVNICESQVHFYLNFTSISAPGVKMVDDLQP